MLETRSTVLTNDDGRDGLRLSVKALLLIASATVVVRLAVMVVLQSWEFPDEKAFGHEMGWIGKWLANGIGFTKDGISPTAQFPPVYPFVVAGFFYVLGTYSKAAAVGLFLFQSVCAAVSAVCLALLGDRIFNSTVGLVAGLVMAIYPTSIFYSVINIWYSELTVMLVLIAVTTAVTAKKSPTTGRVAFLGGLSGLIVLVDSAMVVYVLFLMLWMLFAWRVQLSRFVVLVFLWAATAAVVVTPWAVRNWLVLGSPLVLKSNLGSAFFTGNNSFSSGANDRTEIKQALGAVEKRETNYDRGQSELVYQRHLQNKAFQWIRSNPFRFLKLTALRMVYFWVKFPTHGWKSWLHLSYFGPFVVLALYGLWHSLRRRHLTPVWLFLVVYPLPYYVTFVNHGRYIYPVEPFVVLLAAIPLTIWSRPALCRVFSWQGVPHLFPPSKDVDLRPKVHSPH